MAKTQPNPLLDLDVLTKSLPKFKEKLSKLSKQEMRVKKLIAEVKSTAKTLSEKTTTHQESVRLLTEASEAFASTGITRKKRRSKKNKSKEELQLDEAERAEKIAKEALAQASDRKQKKQMEFEGAKALYESRSVSVKTMLGAFRGSTNRLESNIDTVLAILTLDDESKSVIVSEEQDLEKPQPIEETHDENEEKAWVSTSFILEEIFNYAAADIEHYVEPALDQLDVEFQEKHYRGIKGSLVRDTYYWDDAELSAYDRGSKSRGEIRSRQRTDKGRNVYDTMSKYRRNGVMSHDTAGNTLRRSEAEVTVEGFGINIDALPEDHRAHLEGLGVKDTNCRPLVKLTGPSRRIYYHPAGNMDILLELKCDFLTVETAIGDFAKAKNEIEIEIKWFENMTEEEADGIVSQEMQRIINYVADTHGNEKDCNIKVIKTSKPQEAFEYLDSQRLTDAETFAAQVNALSFDSYRRMAPAAV